MQELGIERYADYLDYLQAETDEFTRLFNTILINVTSFFRDEETWAAIGETVLPELLERDRQVRIWSAGCASGQEPFSIAMLLPRGRRDQARSFSAGWRDRSVSARSRARTAKVRACSLRSWASSRARRTLAAIAARPVESMPWRSAASPSSAACCT